MNLFFILIHDKKLLLISTYRKGLDITTSMGNIEVAKDRFYDVMNKFSLRTKKESLTINLTDWEKTLLITRNMYEEDFGDEKVCDEMY